MPGSLSPFLRRLLELVSAECAPTADRWEGRLARRFRAEYEEPPDGPRGFDVTEALFYRVRELEEAVTPGRRGRKPAAHETTRNYPERD